MDTSGRPHRGVLTGADMANWQPPVEAPLTYDYGRYTVCKAGPWNQGPTRKLTNPIATYYYLDNGARIAKTGETDYAPAYSPNGQQVAYVRATWIEDTAAPMARQPSVLDLRIVNTDGSNDLQVIRLTQGDYVTRLSWSRDGTQLVFDAGHQLIQSGIPANLVDPATDALRSEKAQVEEQLTQSREECAALLEEMAILKKQVESTWASERMANALLRERINDVAAEVARLASALEGPNSTIDALLAAETSRGLSTAAPVAGAGNVEMAEPSDTGNLADRIRALQTHASRLPHSDDPKKHN